ncbi:MAG: hypothetical protein UV61_C0002G0036 [Candidatus Gottesmanbacteria bacterium GW2011_GWB1_43_11]|uniref:Uncharacterized protein n=1 Tax=Candidatus Gottesmanbacteria bacterium GW2011_GWB1_43_11 TaxID=1618446 RepID=A0A0G1CNH4_9BACT|nr:MAG: hypothetical protein UV04_C0031G0008 [Candidatus Gottesmanbacteria bacterium GW2011_GWA2_42_16]KKS53297.1 MAG: hypothetical protein UV17_C0039G0007 [Candidatus Gottesmanbacteria bacterium GW2011_GWA1_42_26]KKS81328.1 MAG: hypothetical protein UV55_C0016G0034 [Candidatus Gottesmanbacteria bacterium GW2011_GWC1_43_10]KKS87315.1 MAG: hypothetical protein UV61_C0002G0036 [Candidatus Gottesmanbacteria bacterium GW2011_GWB1_43_11]OGG25078.1 MAG: hypothetical protein A3A59_00240 [Candidatus Go
MNEGEASFPNNVPDNGLFIEAPRGLVVEVPEAVRHAISANALIQMDEVAKRTRENAQSRQEFGGIIGVGFAFEQAIPKLEADTSQIVVGQVPDEG